jgi:putative membrane protein insertion efficiency factor
MAARVLLALVRFYRRYLSRMKRTSTCRFTPTCSQYALEAIARFGAVRGGALALWRVLRCNPWGKWGYDPVPETFPRFITPHPNSRQK